MVITLWSGPVSIMLTTVTITLKPPAAVQLWQDTSLLLCLTFRCGERLPKVSPPIKEVHNLEKGMLKF